MSLEGEVAIVTGGAGGLGSIAVRLNTIAPGTMRTPIMESMGEDALAKFAQGVPYPKRLGSPDEYAALAQHLLENTYINGEIVRLDGAQRFQPR